MTSLRRGRPARSMVFEQFADAQRRAAGGLPSFRQAPDLWEHLWHAEVHHSTAVEGNTLVLREVEALLRQGRAVGAKELKDYMEVSGYAEASRWVFEQTGPERAWHHDDVITVTELRHLHATALGPVWQVSPHPASIPGESPGGFRLHEIAVFPGGMKPPTFPLVPAMVDDWLTQVNQFGTQVWAGLTPLQDAPKQLAHLHAAFERIHPFLDGNGRTGRLALNLIMVRLGWAPVVVLKSHRRRYLSALDKADCGNDNPLAELLARASIASLYALLPQMAGDDELVPLTALVNDRIALPALRQAVARGRLEASMDASGVWRASRQNVDAYLNSRQHQGAKSA